MNKMLIMNKLSGTGTEIRDKFSKENRFVSHVVTYVIGFACIQGIERGNGQANEVNSSN